MADEVITDEAVNKRQAELDKLRQEAADAAAAAAAAQTAQANRLTMAALDAEEARLRAEIERNKELADPKALAAAAEAQIALLNPEAVEYKIPKGAEVQKQADGSVILLSVPAKEAPDAPTAVTSDTPPEPSPKVPDPTPVAPKS